MSRCPWQFDCVHSSLELAVRHMLVSRVRGRFSRWGGHLYLDADRIEDSRVEVQIDAASIDTGHSGRDEDVRSRRFLDVERFPTIDFRSSAIDRLSDTQYRMSGEMTLRGITRPIALEVERVGHMSEPRGVERVGFVAHGAIDRREFGITFNQLLDHGGVAFGNRIDVLIEVAAVRNVLIQRRA